MCIYISPICNVEVSLFSVNIIKLGILSFLSSHGIRAGVGEAEGIGNESAGASIEGRGTTVR